MADIRCGIDREGAFFAVCLDRRVGYYAYPGSDHAVEAKRAARNAGALLKFATPIIDREAAMRDAVGGNAHFDEAFSRNLKRLVHAVVTSPAVT